MLDCKKAAAYAKRMRQELEELVTKTGGVSDPELIVEVTCQFCSHNDNCEFAWDLYNTDGDCLAIK